MRQPIAAKTHYANGITLLDNQFDEIFHHEKGPGALPATKLEREGPVVKGIVVPHAPLSLSGPCAAWAYKMLAEEEGDSRLYIILAQSQHSTETGVTTETFAMPYGEVRTDQHFIRELVAKGHIALNDEAHRKESVIEVQLPFLQYKQKNKMETIKIVPILVNPETNMEELSIDIKETLVEQDKEATFIFVSNMVSYGRSFHYVPFTENVAKNLASLDEDILMSFKEWNKDSFKEKIRETMAPLSGYSALLMAFQLLTPEKIIVEQHYHSGDINGNYSNSVGYAAIVLK